MHHSRPSTLMIDCLESEFGQSLAFWRSAFGFSQSRRPAANQRYVTLGKIETPLFIRLQKVSANPGYHLDIESDDLPGEVARLEKHGARNARHVKRWYVLQDPSGNAFCVIRPESDGFPGNARRWEDFS
jgi:predicted enzyme related to lactoylglutathione lyase